MKIADIASGTYKYGYTTINALCADDCVYALADATVRSQGAFRVRVDHQLDRETVVVSVSQEDVALCMQFEHQDLSGHQQGRYTRVWTLTKSGPVQMRVVGS